MNRWQRLLTVLLTALLTPIVLLIVVVCAVLIVAINRYSPFFVQERVGKHGEPFAVYKLQTMRPRKPGEEYLNDEHNAARSNWFGDFLRNHGLDELPQFLNIWRGEMGLIGPRPLMQKNIDEIKNCNFECRAIVNVWLVHRSHFLPGITGWHQVNSSGPGIMLHDLVYMAGLPWHKYRLIVWRSLWIIPKSKEQLPGHTATSSVF